MAKVTMAVGCHYGIIYQDGRYRKSNRVVRYNGPGKDMLDCGLNQKRTFKEHRIIRSLKIPTGKVLAAVGKLYRHSPKYY